jgi:hypothetical protein
VRELPFIEAVYLEIDAELERQRTIAEDAGDSVFPALLGAIGDRN